MGTSFRNAAVTLPRLPEAEVIWIILVRARLCTDTLLLSGDVTALLATAFQLIQEAASAKANPDPVAKDFLKHQHTLGPPHLLTGNAWWIFTLESSTGTFVYWRPVELIMDSVDYLH